MKSSMPEGKIVVFDRTPVARLFSCAAAFGAAALLFDYLSRGAAEIEALPLLALVGLVVGTIIAALIQYGDHIYMSSSGVLYENRFLPFLSKRGRWLRWEDVVEVREIKQKVLVILSRDGRRVLVDAIFGYAIARNEIVRYASHAVFSGTLARDDQT